MLCFSPVGTTLRVRSRKFPAVVNCTSIDWFHEWPEEALVSVSSRFLAEVNGHMGDPKTCRIFPTRCILKQFGDTPIVFRFHAVCVKNWSKY